MLERSAEAFLTRNSKTLFGKHADEQVNLLLGFLFSLFVGVVTDQVFFHEDIVEESNFFLDFWFFEGPGVHDRVQPQQVFALGKLVRFPDDHVGVPLESSHFEQVVPKGVEHDRTHHPQPEPGARLDFEIRVHVLLRNSENLAKQDPEHKEPQHQHLLPVLGEVLHVSENRVLETLNFWPEKDVTRDEDCALEEDLELGEQLSPFGLELDQFLEQGGQQVQDFVVDSFSSERVHHIELLLALSPGVEVVLLQNVRVHGE